MDPLKSINLDINRIIIQLFIPGIFAISPFILLFIDRFKIESQNEGYFSTIIFILSLTVGLLLEDIGSEIESEIWDKFNKKKYPNHETEWIEYLKLKINENDLIIAQKYLRTILIRMKFELSLGLALVVMIIGISILKHYINFCQSSCQFWWVCVVIPSIIAIYLFYESWHSSKLLIKTRKTILESNSLVNNNV